ncbi:MAG: acetyl-CoA carboxylase carboxyltransferase subunit alpha [Phycisphaerae bacterium]|nr:acetyl-CoA carboxylase carboxyltransferase subunit alpha [Phycisphaerae bacterium]
MTTVPDSRAAVPAVQYLEFERSLQQIDRAIAELGQRASTNGNDAGEEIRRLSEQYQATLKRIYSGLTPWETVLVARHSARPLVPDYLRMIFRDFCELHGDRAYGDDKAIITGFARIGAHKVMVMGHNKGKDTKERVACHFGCAHPEGYRKALLKMRLAEKFGLPVVCLVDTQGAYPGIGAEERGIAQAIAVNLMEMSRLRTPVVCVVIGEGGSGGALGLGVGDRVAMFRNAFYSVISPEGCAAILWKTAERRQHAAEALKLTAADLKGLNIIDDIIDEPVGGAHRDPEAAAENLEKYITESLTHLKRMTLESLVAKRQERIRNLGRFFESASEPVRGKVTKQRSARRLTSRSNRLAAPVSRSRDVAS